MNILILPSWYPTADDPVKGSFFAEQAAALARFGHTVTVMAVYGDGKKGVHTECRRSGSLTEYLIHAKPLRFHLTFFRILREMRWLLRESGKPDVIHVHSFNMAKYARALRALTGVPYVITEHVTWFESGALSQRELREASRAFSCADGVITVSPGLRETIRPLCGGKKIAVIPNLVNEDFFSRTRQTVPEKPFRFLSVGALMPKKGMDALLAAFQSLVSSGADAHLTICGGGAEEEALKAQAGELLAAGRVAFTGSIPRQEVGRRLSESHAFVLASRVETFGVVFVEAMACGLPIVMTKTNAWEMLAVPETGLAVPVDDAAALAGAMRQLMEHYADYDAGTIRRYCRDNFSETAICRRLTELYEEVLTK